MTHVKKLDYQEKILYMFILNTQRMLIEMIPEDKFDNVFSDHTKDTIVELSLLIEQRLKEIKE